MASALSSDIAVNTLIIVCCHAIYLGQQDEELLSCPKRPDGVLSTNSSNVFQDTTTNHQIKNLVSEANWLIEPFQRDEVPTFLQHIQKGLEILHGDISAILCFSGGATKLEKTSRTEAQGYYEAAKDLDGSHFSRDDTPNIAERVFKEEWATDSFQNILLSLIQWNAWAETASNSRKSREGFVAGSKEEFVDLKKVKLGLPRKLIIVSHEFKRQRFMELHVPAIRDLWEQSSTTPWSIAEIEFVGINPPFDETRMAEIAEGDRKRGYGAWKDDVLGIDDVLRGKRAARGWVRRKFMTNVANKFDERGQQEIEDLVA